MNNKQLVQEGLLALAHLHTARAQLTKKGKVYASSTATADEALTLAAKVAESGLAAVYAKQEVKELPATNGIKMFFHCRKCVSSIPAGESPASHARLSVGFTKEGLQVWCERHDMNVAHIHFEGQQHPCNTGAHEKRSGKRKEARKDAH